ncbi:hypothetical protein QWT69_02685 [Sporosarcina oncorhynchi]|uniref:DUF7695 domain-containing protein n=1 Tax=Sporosarcina oncorhynchi TaxID=3056444 RepID=A0ABZ0L941_9BACL|nr:hypothetical protein [Sporosarcina sp. T2O-4]WOV88046.1 hypothetical protein QWT69_02685 [Sporosarcina sp. T2O-4]
MRKLKRNRIRCTHCGDVIESKSEHDLTWCSCEKVAVDGGLEYSKRLYPAGAAEDHFEDLSEFE